MTRLGPYQRLLLILLFGLCIFGVISTYTRLSKTDDEDFHTTCGMEWLKEGTYTKQPMHPPLARVMDAVFLYLVMQYDKEELSGKPPHDLYLERLVLTRLGTLPFYVLSCVLVFIWSRRLFGNDAALFALALYGSLSSVSAHAALATTDMGYTAALLWAILCGIDWLENPDCKRSLLLGLSLGVMTGTKYSGLVQWPAAMAFIMIGRCLANYKNTQPVLFLNRRHFIHAIIYSLPMVFLALALIFRFSFDPLFKGITLASHLNGKGFGVWFYQRLHNQSVWYFFPVVFFFKTPLSFFAATLLGNGRIIREPTDNSINHLYPLLAATGLLLASMCSHINLGVRHVMTLYPLLAIPAGYGMAWLWNGHLWKRGTAALLMLCQLFSFVQAYPEHLAYFNALAGDHPEHITLDSDFDWGQDMILLGEALQERGISSIYLCARHDTFRAAAFVVPAIINVCPNTPVTGWIAASRAYMLLYDNIAWLKTYKAVQIGNSTMDLYYIPSKEP